MASSPAIPCNVAAAVQLAAWMGDQSASSGMQHGSTVAQHIGWPWQFLRLRCLAWLASALLQAGSWRDIPM